MAVLPALGLSAAFAQEFPVTVPQSLVRQCGLNASDKALIESCLRDFAKNECYTYPGSDPALQDKLATCNLNELKETPAKAGEDFLKSCGTQIVNSYKELYKIAKSIPASFSDSVQHLLDPDTGTLVARKICQEKLGLEDAQVPPLDNLPHLAIGTSTAPWYRCVAEQRNLYKNEVVTKQKAEMAKFFVELNKGLHCFRPRYWPSLGCPLVSDVVLGGAAGMAAKFVAREALPAVARGMSSVLKTVPKFSKKIDDALTGLASRATRPQELLSISHQRDLIGLSQSPYMQGVLEKAGLDRESLAMGILDSDVGKLGSEWNRLVFSKTPPSESEKLLNMLAGRDRGLAGKAFRELLDENGFAGKTVLNPHLSNDQLREVMQKNPVLQAYLHELPGISQAISDLNSGLITAAQFKIRVMANLFHNGPNAGFWLFFGDTITPGALKNGDAAAKSFFRDTIFAGEQTPEGVVRPVYPGPLSAEGIFHTFMDRLSQATRGGMMKIFEELGGKTLADNPKLLMKDFPAGKVDAIGEMLVGNPEKTFKQLEALQNHLRQMPRVSDGQRRVLDDMIREGRKRLQRQQDYIKTHFEKTPEGYKVTLEDAAGTKPVKITGETSADEAKKIMEKLMLQEERINGNPMLDFPSRPSRSGLFYAAAAGEAGKVALTAGICSPSAASSSSAPAVR